MSLLKRLFRKNQPTELVEPPETLPGKAESCWCGSGLPYKQCHLSQDRLFLKRRRQSELASLKARQAYESCALNRGSREKPR